MDTRTGLKTGSEYTLDFSGTEGKRTFEITGEAGRGGSCIVYSVRYRADDRGNYIKGILKEYYPHDVIGLKRDDDGRILVPEAIKDKFEIKKEGFFRGFKLQTELRNREGVLSNSIISAIDRFRGNGTEYLLMTKDNGWDFGNTEGLSLYENIKVIYDFSKILKLVHEEGYLMLDIKPENIFVTLNKEVGLFDFDSLKKLDEIQSGFISGSVDWSAPEVINYIDATEGGNLFAAEMFLESINESSDYYSIGKILKSVVPEDKHDEAYKNTSYEIYGKLEDFFRNTLCTFPEDRYDNDDELISALEEITRLADPKEMFINYYKPSKDENAGYRDKELNELHNMLSNNSSAFITAIGGMGKSELAKMYADKFKDEYDIIQFLNYADSMKETVMRISVNGIDAEQAKDREWLYKKISDILDSQKGNVLIVIDNFDSEAKDIELLANRKNVKVIFTSRLDIKKLYSRYSRQTIELQPLSDEDSESLFCKLYTGYRDEELPVIRDIINTVNKNTLVIRLIALEMEDQGTEGKEILEKLKNANVKDLEGEIFHNEEYRELYGHLLTVFNISQFNDDMKLILLKMSLVPYIYREDIKEWLDEDNFNRINRLKNRGWIEYDNETKQYSLHPVISMLAYEEMYEDRWQECDNLVDKADAFIRDFKEINDFEKRREVSDFAEFAVKRISKDSLKCGNFYNSFAMLQNCLDYYDKALEYYNKSLEIKIGITGEKTLSVTNTYHNMGIVYDNKSEYDKALEYYNKSLEIKMGITGEKTLSVAQTYNNMGAVYSDKSEYDKALEYYNKSLDIEKGIIGENTLSVAGTYNNMGLVYYNKSEYDKALEYYNKSLEIKIGITGKNTLSVAQTYNNMGSVYADKSEYNKAIEYYNKSLEIKIGITGENTISVAQTYNNMGIVYDNKSEYDKAIDYYNKSLEIQSEITGENTLSVADTYNNMGLVYADKSEYDKALEFYNKSLEIQKGITGEKTLSVAETYNNMGAAYAYKSEYDKALEYYNKSLDIEKGITGENTLSVAETYNTMGIVYRNKTEYDKALEYYNKSLEIQREITGENTVSVAETYNNMGLVYAKKSEYDKALDYYNKSLKIEKGITGENTLSVARTYNNMGLVYADKSEYDKALEFYNKSLEIRKGITGENTVSVARTYENVGILYYNIRKYDLALKYIERAYIISLNILGSDAEYTNKVKRNLETVKKRLKDKNEANIFKFLKSLLKILKKEK